MISMMEKYSIILQFRQGKTFLEKYNRLMYNQS